MSLFVHALTEQGTLMKDHSELMHAENQWAHINANFSYPLPFFFSSVLSCCRVYNISKKTELGTLLQHDGTITALQFCGKAHLLSGSEDGMICIWQTVDWVCMKTLVGHKAGINSITVHPSGW